MTKHKDIPYILHIRDAILDIEAFTKNLTKDNFLKNKLKQSAVVRQLEIVGEATKNKNTCLDLSQSLYTRQPFPSNKL